MLGHDTGNAAFDAHRQGIAEVVSAVEAVLHETGYALLPLGAIGGGTTTGQTVVIVVHLETTIGLAGTTLFVGGRVLAVGIGLITDHADNGSWNYSHY